MPYFRMKVKRGNQTGFFYRTVEAPDINFARNGNYTIIKIWEDKNREARLERRNYWKKVWQQALANMPVKFSRKEVWEPCPGISMPDFIKGTAYKKIKLIDGKPHRLERVPFGQSAALAHCMGFVGRYGEMQLQTAIAQGYCPKELARRELLLDLATPITGRILSWKMLTERHIYYHAYNLR